MLGSGLFFLFIANWLYNRSGIALVKAYIHSYFSGSLPSFLVTYRDRSVITQRKLNLNLLFHQSIREAIARNVYTIYAMKKPKPGC